MPSPVEIVRRFRSLRALVIGDAMLDSYVEGTAARLCSEGPVPVVRASAQRHVPGGAANTATNVRALGAEVIFLGIVGDDHGGRLLRSAILDSGVDDRWLVQDPEASTLHKQRIVADGQYVVRVDDGDTLACSKRGQEELLSRLEAAFALADVVVVSDYGYGACPDRLIARLTELREQRPVPLIVDSKQLRRFANARATIVTPNHLEARLLVEGGQIGRVADATVAEMTAVGLRLLEEIDAELMAITMASDGVVLVSRGGSLGHVPAHQVPNPADVGAGDTFASTLALAMTVGAEPLDAVRIGIDAAGIAVAKPGTSAVDHQELLQRVSVREIASGDLAGNREIERLTELLMVERLSGRSVVFTNGVFDILHAGHVRFLREAKALGDVLVVGVNSDRGAARLKGKSRPINHERDRLALISALDAVDHAILFDEDTPASLIRTLQPDIHVKGGDYDRVELPEEEAVVEVGGRVVILPLAGEISTSAIIDRIVALAATVDGMEAVHD